MQKLNEVKIDEVEDVLDGIQTVIDPAERAARQIVRRGLKTDVETMTIIIRNAYEQRTEQIKKRDRAALPGSF